MPYSMTPESRIWIYLQHNSIKYSTSRTFPAKRNLIVRREQGLFYAFSYRDRRTTLRGNTTGQIIHRRVGRSEEEEAANRLV